MPRTHLLNDASANFVSDITKASHQENKMESEVGKEMTSINHSQSPID